MKLTDLTPEHMRCGGSLSSCPSILETETGDLVIIGAKPSQALLDGLGNRIGNDEIAIVIDPALLANLAVW